MFIVDRIEDEIVVVETDDGMIELNIKQIPCEIREGDVLTKTDDIWLVDKDATESRRSKMIERMRRLRNE